MKKLFIYVATITATSTYAQKKETSLISYGIKAGMNVSFSSKTSNDIDRGPRIGFSSGIFVTIPLNTQFNLQPELLYSQLGSKEFYPQHEGEQSYTTLRNTIRSNYLTLPVMLQYNATPKFFLEAGPEFGLLLNQDVKSTTETLSFYGDTSTDTKVIELDKNSLHKFRFGFGIGTGYYFTSNIGLTARYIVGLTNYLKTVSNRDNVFQVGGIYKF